VTFAAPDTYQYVNYGGGIYKGPCAANINHAVTVVGYGTTMNG
jgi:hypothetical protein